MSTTFIFKKPAYETPPTKPEENSIGFFQLPPRTFTVKKETQESLAKRVQNQPIQKGIQQEVEKGNPILVALEFVNPERDPLIPTLKSLQEITNRYAQKYGIEILFSSEEEAPNTIQTLVQKPDCNPRGLIISREGKYHVSPILFYKDLPENKWQVLMMDCTESKTALDNTLQRLLINKHHPTMNLMLSRGTRLGDGHSCRTEAISLLKYALLWAKQRPDCDLSKTLRCREETVYGTPVKIFQTPKQWAVGAQIKDSLQGGALEADSINHKGETFLEWQKRHASQNVASIRVVLRNETETCESSHLLEKPMNLYLIRKVDRFAQQTMPMSSQRHPNGLEAD